MKFPWRDAWFESASPARRDLWRGVEAQHQVATMRLVDDLDEQYLLEQLLDASKPPLPAAAKGLHYLLATPFRYRSPWPSRFRLPDHAGAWYGADSPQTVAAEIVHWRRRFFMDSAGLREGELVTEHTFFQARFKGVELDLTQVPWDALRETLRHPDDYTACHALATQARARRPAIAALRYESARRETGLCNVVFDAAALSLPQPDRQQTWICKTTAQRIMLTHGGRTLQFTY